MGVLVVAVLAAVLTAAAVVQPQQGERVTPNGAVIAPTTLSEVVARCSGTITLPEEYGVAGVVDPAPVELWQTLGVADSDLPRGDWTLDSGLYFPYQATDLAVARSTLDTGAVVVWYDPSIERVQLTGLSDSAGRVSEELGARVTVTPLPENLARVTGYPIVYTQRGRLLGCEVPSVDVIREFLSTGAPLGA